VRPTPDLGSKMSGRVRPCRLRRAGCNRGRQPLGGRMGTIGRDDAHRYDKFQGVIHAHIHVAHLLGPHDQGVSRGRVRCGRHIDRQRVRIQVPRKLGAGIADHETHHPLSALRELQQYGAPERMAVLGQQGVRYLLHAAIDVGDDRNAPQHRFPPGHQALADDVGRQHTSDEHDCQGQHESSAGQMKTEPLFRPPGRRQYEQGLIHERQDDVEHPNGKRERNPHQQTRHEVALEHHSPQVPYGSA
jgi:hypothetical protein